MDTIKYIEELEKEVFGEVSEGTVVGSKGLVESVESVEELLMSL